MTKKLIEIDDHLLDQAKDLLGLETMNEVVDLSLRELVSNELRRRHLRRLTSGDGVDLADEQILSRAWRS